MSSILPRIARLIAGKLTIWRNLVVSLSVLSLLVGLVQLQNMIVIFIGFIIFIILYIIQKACEKLAAVTVLMQEPDTPRSLGNEFTITGTSIRLNASAIIPQWTGGCIIKFEENPGYGVILSNYPQGVDDISPNEIRVDEGVPEFDFTVKISRETDGGTYKMRIIDSKNNYGIKEVKLNL